MKRLKSIVVFFKSFPLNVIAQKIKCKVFQIKIPHLKDWQVPFVNRKGIEIGGPSAIFNVNGYLPLYSLVANIDGVNFSTSTVWEGDLSEGENYHFEGRKGHQFISEGGNLDTIESFAYDFLISCNNLEHIANPIATIIEWKRVIKPGGVMLLILPRKGSNFDHRRPFTTMEHLVEDYKNEVTEKDLTHLEEILKLHDLNRDPQARPFEKFKERCENNFLNRCMHHHVFNQELLSEIADYCDLKVLMNYSSYSDHFISLQA